MGKRSGKPKFRSVFSRTFRCPGCRSAVRIPFIWVLGVESVFACRQCGQRFKTGYKTGAVLSALGLTAAVVTANLGAYLFSSYSIPIMALAVIPLWLLYGFFFRKLRLIGKVKRELRQGKR